MGSQGHILFCTFYLFCFSLVGKAKALYLLHVSDCKVPRVVEVEDTQDTRFFFWFLAGVEERILE